MYSSARRDSVVQWAPYLQFKCCFNVEFLSTSCRDGLTEVSKSTSLPAVRPFLFVAVPLRGRTLGLEWVSEDWGIPFWNRSRTGFIGVLSAVQEGS